MSTAQKIVEFSGGDISKEDFYFFKNTIFELSGISLSNRKVTLLKKRLQDRMEKNNFSNFSEYRKFLCRIPRDHEEWTYFINMLTTNKTDWFRESKHFDYLVNDFLPEWKKLKKNKLRIWSAASSTGEEAYTLSMVLDKHLEGADYEIWATDIDTKVIRIGDNGVYKKEYLNQVPEKYRHNFLFGTDGIDKWMKIKDGIKQKVFFDHYNLVGEAPPKKEEFDLVFCRNVLIYFEKETIERVLRNLYFAGAKESLLFVGHSESLQKIPTEYRYHSSSIYSKGRFFER